MWSRNPRLIRDCAVIEEPPNVVTGPLLAHVSCPFLQGLARQGSAGCTSLWLVYISMYMKIVLLFSVHMTSAIVTFGVAIDSRLIGDSTLPRNLYFDQRPHAERIMWKCPSQPVARILLRIPLRSEGAWDYTMRRVDRSGLNYASLGKLLSHEKRTFGWFTVS